MLKDISSSAEQTIKVIDNLSVSVDNASKRMATLSSKSRSTAFTDVIGEVHNLTTNMLGNISASSTLGKVYKSLDTGVSAYGSTVKVVNGLNTLFNLGLKATPIGWIVGGISAITEAIGLFSDKKREAIIAASDHTKALIKEHTQVNTLITELNNTRTPYKRRVEIIEELAGIQPSLVEGISAEGVEYDKLKDKLKGYNDEKEREIFLSKFQDELDAFRTKVDDAKNDEEDAEKSYIKAVTSLWTDIESSFKLSKEQKESIGTLLQDKTEREGLIDKIRIYASNEFRIETLKKRPDAIGIPELQKKNEARKNILVDKLGSEDALDLFLSHNKNITSTYYDYQKKHDKTQEKQQVVDEKANFFNTANSIFNSGEPLEITSLSKDDISPENLGLLLFNIQEFNKLSKKDAEALSNNSSKEIITDKSENKTTSNLRDKNYNDSQNYNGINNRPVFIPGASDTANNVISGGTSQRIININVQKFQDAVNNYFNGDKEAESKVSSFMDMMNEGWMRILNSANQMA